MKEILKRLADSFYQASATGGMLSVLKELVDIGNTSILFFTLFMFIGLFLSSYIRYSTKNYVSIFFPEKQK